MQKPNCQLIGIGVAIKWQLIGQLHGLAKYNVGKADGVALYRIFLAIRLMLQVLVTCNTCESEDGKIRKL